MSEPGSHISDVLALFRAQGQLSRIDVMDVSGLSRSTVNQRLATLTAAGLISPVGGGESTGGRPSTRFGLNSARAVLLTADIGASGFVAAVCDLAGVPLRHLSFAIDVWEGPEPVLGAVQEAFDELLQGEDLWGIGIGVPGPVEFAAGRVVNPPIMTGWDRFDIAGWFTSRHGVTVVVENDANARAVKESRQHSIDNLISLKLGTGIGAGLVFNGQIIRGNEGAAGDVGHTRAALAWAGATSGQGSGGPEGARGSGRTDPFAASAAPLACRCGNVGCVEAYAGGWALVRDIAARRPEVQSVADVVDLVKNGDIEAVRLVRAAGRVLGDAVAGLVSVLNPAMIVLSGQLSNCDEVLLSGIRERVYQRSLPLATRNLIIKTSDLGELVGVSGLALITADRIFGATEIDALLLAVAVTPTPQRFAG